MREDDIDDILRRTQAHDISPPPLSNQARRRPSRLAAVILVLVVLGLVIVPFALARAGDPMQLLLGVGFGDPFGF